MSPEELDAARRAMVELRAAHDLPACRTQAILPLPRESVKPESATLIGASLPGIQCTGANVYNQPDKQGPSDGPKGSQTSASTCKLMAKNIPQEIPIKAVRAHFSKYGDVANITLCFAKSSLGHAIITYTTPEAVLRAAKSSAV